VARVVISNNRDTIAASLGRLPAVFNPNGLFFLFHLVSLHWGAIDEQLDLADAVIIAGSGFDL
jgi:hypothetical protein